MNLFEAARVLEVSKVTMRDWLDKGIIDGTMHTTPGGRISWIVKDKDVYDLLAKEIARPPRVSINIDDAV